MMLTVKPTTRFKRGLRKAHKRGLNIDLLTEVVEKLRCQIPLESKYNDHPLKGEYKGFRECHIQPEWLLVYLVENDILTLTLIDTGSHADIFDM